ncbi:MAG: sn-glycerol-3-phosphate ABC transporter ATP-binding protein UgpC [Burkholderiaceae bacterium]
MARVEFVGINKTYDQKVVAVRNLDLVVEDKEFVVLVGPSGCGKSTTLRMLAGLEDITAGDLLFDGKRVNDMSPAGRNIAMVFQNYALYPHMSVRSNMAFGLKNVGLPAAEIDTRVNEASRILGLDDLLDRKPAKLSGGQRQRVAMGRAIVRHPSVFLFDEPLSNLDAKLRTQMRGEIKRLHQRVNTTVIYVTHDQVEAMTLADRIVVMRDGRIEQAGTPTELFNNPINMFVASFLGSPSMNMVPARLEMRGGSRTLKSAQGLSVRLPANVAPGQQSDRDVIFGIRPDDIAPADGATPSDAHQRGKVVVTEPMGAETYFVVDAGGHEFVAKALGRQLIKPGADIDLAFGVADIKLFDPTSQLTLS